MGIEGKVLGRVVVHAVMGAVVGAVFCAVFALLARVWQMLGADHEPFPLTLPAMMLSVFAFSGGAYTHKTRWHFVVSELFTMAGSLVGIRLLLVSIDRSGEFGWFLLLGVVVWIMGYLVHEKFKRPEGE